MVSASDFVDGTTIRFRALATTAVGAVLLAWYEGLIRVILESGRQASRLVEGVGEFVAMAIRLILGTPALIIRGSYTETIAAAGSAGIAAYAVSVLAVAVLLWTVAQGVSAWRSG